MLIDPFFIQFFCVILGKNGYLRFQTKPMIMKKSILILPLLILGILSSCSKKSSCSYRDDAVSVPASEVTAIQTYLDSIKVTATKDPRGFYYVIDQPGSGVKPTVCSSISFTYKGELTNGNTFDQSSNPVTYHLGDLISGWKKGIPLIAAGGKIHLYLPPSLGYGSVPIKDQSGNVIIPANSVLIFEIGLVSVSN